MAEERAKTLLAFDYGLRQLGVAVGNSQLRSSQALPILKARDGIPNWDEIAALIETWQPDLFIVGNPLNMDGSESELGLRAKKFARRLNGRFSRDFVLVDERLSSFEAKQQHKERGHRGNYKDQPIDSYAAELIMQTWFNSLDR